MSSFELPGDPKNGQIVEVPEGNEGESYSQVLVLYQGSVCIGYTESASNIPNVSGALELGKSFLSKKIKVGEKVRVQQETIPVASMTFVNFFGWQPYTYHEKIVDLAKNYEVVFVNEVPSEEGVQILCERVCLQRVEGDRDGSEQPSNGSTNDGTNETTPTDGATPEG